MTEYRNIVSPEDVAALDKALREQTAVCGTCFGDGIPEPHTPASQAAEMCPTCNGSGATHPFVGGIASWRAAHPEYASLAALVDNPDLPGLKSYMLPVLDVMTALAVLESLFGWLFERWHNGIHAGAPNNTDVLWWAFKGVVNVDMQKVEADDAPTLIHRCLVAMGAVKEEA